MAEGGHLGNRMSSFILCYKTTITYGTMEDDRILLELWTEEVHEIQTVY